MSTSGLRTGPFPSRILFALDLQVGSHAGDIERLGRILRSAADLRPDLMCLAGDYINGLLFGGERVPPETIASNLALTKVPLGSLAVLGDHALIYGADAIAAALRGAGHRSRQLGGADPLRRPRDHNQSLECRRRPA